MSPTMTAIAFLSKVFVFPLVTHIKDTVKLVWWDSHGSGFSVNENT